MTQLVIWPIDKRIDRGVEAFDGHDEYGSYVGAKPVEFSAWSGNNAGANCPGYVHI